MNSRVTATDEIDGDITQSITKTCTYTYKDIDHQTITCPTDFLNLEH
ncbi:MAG: hypothetical protein LBC61_05290 [Candidatus Peribacteria bacterium]|nr:hypothetical protein [Candidatus Peribacteria bacterium]